MGHGLAEATAETVARDFQLSGQRRTRSIAQAIDSGAVITWATDLDGIVTLSEGGGLAPLGLYPGETVGMDVRTWDSVPFDEALEKLRRGAKVVRYLTKGGDAPEGAPAEVRAAWESVWIVSLTYLRSPSGRPVGVSFVTMAIDGAIPTTPFQACPLGGCVVEGQQNGTAQRGTGSGSP